MSDEWDEKQIRMAAADLCERAAKALRDNEEYAAPTDIIDCALCVLAATPTNARDDYDCGLANANVGDAERTAALRSILAGEHPPDSLPAFVERMAHAYSIGDDDGFDWVATLERIGAKR